MNSGTRQLTAVVVTKRVGYAILMQQNVTRATRKKDRFPNCLSVLCIICSGLFDRWSQPAGFLKCMSK